MCLLMNYPIAMPLMDKTPKMAIQAYFHHTYAFLVDPLP